MSRLEEMAANARLQQMQERARELSAQPAPPPPSGGSSVSPEMQGGGPAFRRALANPFQLGDEIAGLVGAFDPDTGYQLARDEARWMLANDRQEHPTASMLGQAAGDIVTGAAIAGPVDDFVRAAAPILRGTGMATRMVRTGLAGGIEGAAYGYAGGEGVEDRLASALTLGGIGLGVGAAMPPTAEVVRRLVTRPVTTAANIGNRSRAAERMVRALDEAGLSPDDVDDALRAAQADGQDMFTVADAIGPAGADALSGVTTQPGAGRQVARDILEERLDQNTRRLAGYVEEAYDAGGATAAQQRARQITSRADDARVNYDAMRASAQPVNVTGAVAEIDNVLRRDAPVGEASSFRQTSIGRKLREFRERMAAELGDDVQGPRRMQTDIEAIRELRTDLRLWREQNPLAASQTNDLYNALTDALAEASPDFRTANDQYRTASRLIEAGEAGRATPRTARADDIIDQYDNLRTPEERNAFRLAFADRDLGTIEAAPGSRNLARTLYGGNSPSMRGETVAMRMVDDPDLFARRVGREDTMTQTTNRALRGSQTASNLAEQSAADGVDVGILQNLLQGNFFGAGGQALGRAYNVASGSNEGTRQAIARALLSSDPGSVAAAIAPAQRNEAFNRMIAGLIRGASRDPALQAAR